MSFDLQIWSEHSLWGNFFMKYNENGYEEYVIETTTLSGWRRSDQVLQLEFVLFWSTNWQFNMTAIHYGLIGMLLFCLQLVVWIKTNNLVIRVQISVGSSSTTVNFWCTLKYSPRSRTYLTLLLLKTFRFF